MRLPPIGTIKKIYCNTCKMETNHELIGAHLRRYNQKWDYDIHLSGEENMYCLWLCRGCETATFEDIYTECHWPSDVYFSTFYPKRENLLKPILKDYQQLPSELWAIYKEVIQGFNNGLNIICAMGLRAMLEGICVERGITDRVAYSFTKKLIKLKEQLEEQNDLPDNVSIALDDLKKIGDSAAHRLELSTREKLEHAIKFTEYLIEFIYKIEHRKTVTGLSHSSEHFCKET